MLLGLIAAFAGGLVLVIAGSNADSPPAGVAGVVILALSVIGFGGLFLVPPNIAKVLVLFGRYRGTVRRNGWHWVNPFTKKEIVCCGSTTWTATC